MLPRRGETRRFSPGTAGEAVVASEYFRRRAVSEMPITSSIIVEYGFGAGGRALDLPPQYLDAICEANTHAHPRTLDRRVSELLVSGRFRPSKHPRVRGKTLAELRAYHHDIDNRHTQDYRARHGKRKRVTKVTQPVV